MYRIKAVALVALVIVALTGSIMWLAGDESVLPVQNIEANHARARMILNEKLLNAELSLNAQAEALAGDTQLAQALAEVREKLTTTTADELKRQSNNAWNLPVFNRLVHWKQQLEAAINQADANNTNVMKAYTGSMTTMMPLTSRWEKAPGLVLAFAAVPLKDNQISAVMVAYGQNGSELRGGKRYDEEIEMLAEANQSGKPVFGHFPFDGKMYIAVAQPVMSAETQVGTIVIGYELSREMLETLRKSLPDYIDLMLAYTSPRENGGNKTIRRNFTTANDTIKKTIETGKFHINTSAQYDASSMIAYDTASLNTVYAAESPNPIAFSRSRWVWDATQQSDVYVISNLSQANTGNDKLRINILIAGILALIAGCGLMIAYVNSILRNSQYIRKSIADAITSGEAIDAKAMGLILNEAPDALPPYTIQEHADSDDDGEWGGMMDVDDESNENADKAMSDADIQNLTESADLDEIRPLYEEYMRLRKENNNNNPMEFDVFVRRLQRNAAQIKEKYHCSKVNFKVQVVDGNVILKPQITK